MKLSVLLTAAVVLALAVIGQRLTNLASHADQAESLNRQRAAVEVMARDAAGLLVLTQEYLLRSSPRALRQWAPVHRDLTNALQDYATAGAVQQAEVAELAEVLANLPPLFTGLQRLQDQPANAATNASRETLADQLLNGTGRISVGAFEVSNKVTERSSAANLEQRHQALATQAAMLMLVLLLAWLLLRRVLRPLDRVRRGAQAVQDGDLGARIGYRSSDEIGRLSQAFDTMTAALQERAAALQASNEQLARSEAFQERVSLVAGVGGWELELESGRLTWSAQTRVIHEVEADFEPTLETAVAFYAPEAQAMLNAVIAATMDDGTPWDLELPLTTARGRGVWVRATGAAESRDGRLVRLVGAFQDITARRATDAALREAVHAARAASNAKTAFLANMSHEIRTPLNAVIGLSYLMQQTRLDADQAALQGKISLSGRALLEVVNNVLDLSKIEAGELALESAPFDLRLLVNELGGVFAPLAALRGIALHTALPAALPRWQLGDVARLRQMLTNLLSNALKFTARGEVRLDVTVDDADARPLQLRFTVEDSGIGMSPEVLDRLFTPFAQADTSITRRFGGTGLGLSIVKRLVTPMGGTITVDSVAGQGSRFALTLPFEPADADAAIEPGPAPLEVLVAEDEEEQREALVVLCRQLGWRTEAVAGGEALVDSVRARRRDGPALDALLVDWRMPEPDGLQALVTLSKDVVSSVSPAVVLLSAGVRDRLPQVPLLATLADGLLDKPVTASGLFNAVHAAVARRTGDATRVLLASALDAAGIARLPGVRVLVVDDSDINREVAQRILTQEGAVVMLAADGAEAVAMLRTHGHAVDAVLMDLQMPVLDGLSATRQIRGELGLARLPIIALTAGALLSESQHAQEAGMNNFVSKPFEPHALVTLLHRVVERSRGTPLPLAPRAVTAIAAAGAPAWPEIDGVDSADVQRRLLGDLRLFTRLLQQLCEEFGDLALPAPLPDGSVARTALTARLHKLAGGAGQLGATRLRRAAAAAEQALRSGTAPELTPVDAAMRDLLDGSAVWRAQARQQHEASSKLVEQVRGAAPDTEAFEVWKAQLVANDLAAMTQFDRLAPWLRATWGPERFDAVEGALGRLAFTEVLVLVGNE